MSISQAVPSAYGYVGAAGTSLASVLLWQTFLVSKARKAAGIKQITPADPNAADKVTSSQMYASPEEQKASKAALVFNCTQRAHQNTLEATPIMLFSTAFVGLQYPRFAAAACALYTLGRILYTIGYTTGEPDNRKGLGTIGEMGYVALLLGSGFVSYRFIADGISSS
ncbi:MAG: hypothetical protein CYPHOPRED_004931 [Cyphobasidiales sp. Tagirdzhanova-0007]|nr:MAG: hypothetical protein CYPHOPRED_004931 [Cyphobasidiales sp. Tagirdzhanova-0007]